MEAKGEAEAKRGGKFFYFATYRERTTSWRRVAPERREPEENVAVSNREQLVLLPALLDKFGICDTIPKFLSDFQRSVSPS